MGFNVEPGAEEDYAHWMDEEHLPNLSRVPGVLSARRFVATESSHKYELAEIDQLATDTGFTVSARWVDDAWGFASNLFVVE